MDFVMDFNTCLSSDYVPVHLIADSFHDEFFSGYGMFSYLIIDCFLIPYLLDLGLDWLKEDSGNPQPLHVPRSVGGEPPCLQCPKLYLQVLFPFFRLIWISVQDICKSVPINMHFHQSRIAYFSRPAPNAKWLSSISAQRVFFWVGNWNKLRFRWGRSVKIIIW